MYQVSLILRSSSRAEKEERASISWKRVGGSLNKTSFEAGCIGETVQPKSTAADNAYEA